MADQDGDQLKEAWKKRLAQLKRRQKKRSCTKHDLVQQL